MLIHYYDYHFVVAVPILVVVGVVPIVVAVPTLVVVGVPIVVVVPTLVVPILAQFFLWWFQFLSLFQFFLWWFPSQLLVV